MSMIVKVVVKVVKVDGKNKPKEARKLFKNKICSKLSDIMHYQYTRGCQPGAREKSRKFT